MSPGDNGGPFGHVIRSQRIRKGLTQQQLADLSTVAVRTIRDLESGRTFRPHPETVRLLASALALPDREYEVVTHADHDEPVDPYDPATAYAPPLPQDAVVGREDETDVLYELLLSSRHRLVTVTGLAGTGKTAVAAELAAVARRTTDLPVLWVSHPPAAAPDRQPQNRQRGAHTDIGVPIPDAPCLLVVDGVGAGGTPAADIGALLHRHPPLRVLATSRAPLRLAGERVVPLTPLALPAPGVGVEDVARAPAVRVFTRFVHRVQPSFRLTEANAPVVCELCRRFDGVPGVLEAVAAQLLLFRPDTLLDCLDADPAGLVTDIAPEVATAVRDALSDLDPQARRLLLDLAGRPGDWSVDEAARLVGLAPIPFARDVRRLLEVGLVRPSPSAASLRFQVLELVRMLQPAAVPTAV
jgi:transcriptional regulator with XRE-family HTH domain